MCGDNMRIDKFISERGIASRKEAAVSAKKGLLLVNGEPVKDVSRHINPEIDKVVFMNTEIVYRKHTFVMLNKPEGYVSATEDSRLPVVTELLPLQLQRMELFPVGRLDRDTVGLMILTNDGATAHRLLSPKKHVEKTYRFKCALPLPTEAEAAFREGITLLDGYECKSAVLALDSDRLGGEITLTEGKYHQIKRMIASFDNRVTYLERISFAGIALDRTLTRGQWRYLTDAETEQLFSRDGREPQND